MFAAALIHVIRVIRIEGGVETVLNGLFGLVHEAMLKSFALALLGDLDAAVRGRIPDNRAALVILHEALGLARRGSTK